MLPPLPSLPCAVVPIHLYVPGGYSPELPYTSFSMIRIPKGSAVLW